MKQKAERISKFIHRKTNIKEELDMLKWVQSEDYEQELAQAVSDDLEDAYSMDELESEDLSHIYTNIISNTESKIPKRSTSLFRTSVLYKYVATLLLFCLIGLLVYEYALRTDVTVEAESTQVVKTNVKGRKSTIHLSDGSVIYLNSESSISYPQKFSDSLRIVELKGEAFFEVKHHENKPFIVKAGDLDIKVLGTSFNVRTFEGMNEMVVSLATGKVEIKRSQEKGSVFAEESVILFPGQRIDYHKENQFFSSVYKFDPVLEFGWKDGILAFENASVEEVVQILERWYNVDIQLLNYPEDAWQYKARHDNESLELVLKSIAYNEGIDFEIDGNKVLINLGKH